jgi:O-antigen/teichoic acid export membrane protein
VTFLVSLGLSLALIPRWGAIGAAYTVLASSALACCLFCAGAFRPDPTRVLMTFGKAGLAAASLAGFLAIWRHAHPAALAIGAFGVYIGVLGLLRVSSAREFSAFFRGLP